MRKSKLIRVCTLKACRKSLTKKTGYYFRDGFYYCKKRCWEKKGEE